MSKRAVYSRQEVARLRDDVAAGRTPRCPRCDRNLRPSDVLPRTDVAYVRTRTWWMCGECGRSIVLDAGVDPAHPVAPEARKGRPRRPRARRPILGWREWVALPDLGIGRIKAKVDTGARSSALHAVEIEEIEGPRGSRLRFTVYPLQRSTRTALRVEAPLVDRRPVRSSSGRQEVRPVVKVDLEIAGARYPTELTLARRDQMGFRMLLGRTALRRRFLVDPGRSFLQSSSKKPDTST